MSLIEENKDTERSSDQSSEEDKKVPHIDNFAQSSSMDLQVQKDLNM